LESLERLWQRSSPPDEEAKQAPPGRRGWGFRILLIAAAVLGLFILINIAKGFYTNWLWFDDLGYESVYATVLRTKVLIFVVAAVVFFLLFGGNVVLAMRLAPRGRWGSWPLAMVDQLRRISWWSVVGVTVLLSLIFGLVVQDRWLVVLQFLNGQTFGVADPVFHQDVSFYVFSLPFLRLVYGWLLGALIVVLIGSIGIYAASYAVQRLRFDFSRPVLAHVGGLAIAILGLFAWGYRLGIWELVFSERGMVFGASYADMHAKLPAQWILFGVVIAGIGLVVTAVILRRPRWALYGLVGWVVAAIVVSWIFPALVQRLQVQPNELARETPYIEYNIQFTREAFALDRVEEQSFPAAETPSAEDIAENEVTISNIRLWDPRPLKNTYNQIQSFRPYYDFNDVDIDRYIIDGEYRQVMLSARELSAEKLPVEAQTWVNRRLQFTHGYGAVLSPVNEVSTQGLPNLLLKDIPPVGVFNVEQPEIYFGEKTNDYVIVNTKSLEFDYPLGDENVYGEYQGEGGVSLDGFIRRLVYAWQMADFNILISGELTPQSRILYHRNIQERVRRVAPFLKLDADPYLVLMDGRLLWIQDAYTVTDRYPYSEPYRGELNYIRNSVKAVVDAYDGSTTFYVADAEDALIRTYQAIFPELFVPAGQMPESLRAHLRYPEDMFTIQASVYETYHMRDARVFYNKEDPWAVPREVYFGGEQLMGPYYVIMRLPGEEKEEFLLMLPFTPVGKNVTISWLAARCDGENYGKLLVYRFPKERLVYGPSQIENRIGQDTVITEQLALWGRGGSRVIRGNLLLIPLGESMLFVEPVFLEAETGGLPELKRVIVVAGDKIAMERTLEESIAAIFGTVLSAEMPVTEPLTPDEPVEVPPTTPEEPTVAVVAEITALIEEAQQHYARAQELLRAGDWAGFGEEWEALEEVLAQLEELTTGE